MTQAKKIPTNVQSCSQSKLKDPGLRRVSSLRRRGFWTATIAKEAFRGLLPGDGHTHQRADQLPRHLVFAQHIWRGTPPHAEVTLDQC